jgi:hypothetical protein
LSKVKVTLVNYTDFIRADVDRKDCGALSTTGTGIVVVEQLRNLIERILDGMDVENVEVVTKNANNETRKES